MSGGQIVAICVDNKGKNFVIDQRGNNLGAMERLVNIGGGWQIDATSSDQLSNIQIEIQRVLGERRIRQQMLPNGLPNEYVFASALGNLTLIDENGILKVKDALGLGSHQGLNDFLNEDQIGRSYARTAGTSYLHSLEQSGLDLALQSDDAGTLDLKIFPGEAHWEDPTTKNPAVTPNFEALIVDLGRGERIFYQKERRRSIPGNKSIAISAPSAPVDIDAPPAADQNQIDRLCESAYFYLTQAPLEKRKEIAKANYMPDMRVDNIAGNNSYLIGIDNNGNIILRDVSDFSELHPSAHNALDFLNEKVILGEISNGDFQRIRTELGKHYIHAENEHLRPLRERK